MVNACIGKVVPVRLSKVTKVHKEPFDLGSFSLLNRNISTPFKHFKSAVLIKKGAKRLVGVQRTNVMTMTMLF